MGFRHPNPLLRALERAGAPNLPDRLRSLRSALTPPHRGSAPECGARRTAGQPSAGILRSLLNGKPTLSLQVLSVLPASCHTCLQDIDRRGSNSGPRRSCCYGTPNRHPILSTFRLLPESLSPALRPTVLFQWLRPLFINLFSLGTSGRFAPPQVQVDTAPVHKHHPPSLFLFPALVLQSSTHLPGSAAIR